jgi:hypothetical protein
MEKVFNLKTRTQAAPVVVAKVSLSNQKLLPV